jgi:hypothetical protein
MVWGFYVASMFMRSYTLRVATNCLFVMITATSVKGQSNTNNWTSPIAISQSSLTEPDGPFEHFAQLLLTLTTW